VENCEPEGLFTLASDDVIFGQNPKIQLVCAESAVKFNIWDVVSVVLSLIIKSSDEIDSFGLFTVGFKLLQAYYEPLASNDRSVNTAVEVNHTFSYYAQYSAR